MVIIGTAVGGGGFGEFGVGPSREVVYAVAWF
jgi:hypothetical protein